MLHACINDAATCRVAGHHRAGAALLEKRNLYAGLAKSCHVVGHRHVAGEAMGNRLRAVAFDPVLVAG
jgi:hypothetical protein